MPHGPVLVPLPRAHPAVGQRDVVVPRVELQRDEGDVRGDGGRHGLHRLVHADGHVLRRPGQERHAICQGAIHNFRFGSKGQNTVLDHTQLLLRKQIYRNNKTRLKIPEDIVRYLPV